MKRTDLVRKLKLFFLKFARSRSSTSEIAWGAAIGTFISVFPTFGFGMPLVLLMNRFLQFNLLAALALSIVSNPFTSPFFLLLMYKTGSIITGNTIDFTLANWNENITGAWWILLTGSLVVSGLSSVLAYVITKIAVSKFRSNPAVKSIE